MNKAPNNFPIIKNSISEKKHNYLHCKKKERDYLSIEIISLLNTKNDKNHYG